MNEAGKLTAEELFVTAQILLESRGLCKSEFSAIFEKMMQCCSSPQDLQQTQKMLNNEKYHYTEPSHKKELISTIWDLGRAVQECHMVELTYERLTEPRWKNEL